MRAITKEELSYQYFPFYVAQWIDDTAALSAAGEGCLIRLLARQWKAGILPADPAVLGRLTNATTVEWRKVWKELEPLFPLSTDPPGRRNLALLALRVEREAFIEQKRQAGRAGGRPKSTPASGARAERNRPQNHQANHQPERNESSQKPYGFDSLEAEAKRGETLELLVVEAVPPSPSPGGEGASPTAPPQRRESASAFDGGPELLPGESLDAYRRRTAAAPRAGTPASFEAAVAAALAAVPDVGREITERFLRESYIAETKLTSWARRITGWTNGLGTSRMRPVTWPAVELGIGEMLDTNPIGQTITPQQLLTFVESAQRRLTDDTSAGPRRGPNAPAVRPAVDEDEILKQFAADGDPDAIAACESRGLDYTARATA